MDWNNMKAGFSLLVDCYFFAESAAISEDQGNTIAYIGKVNYMV